MFCATISIQLKEPRPARVQFFVGDSLQQVLVKNGQAPAQPLTLSVGAQDTILGIDCFVYETNASGALCAVRIGVDSVYLTSSLDMTKCALRHPSTKYLAGYVTLTKIQCPDTATHGVYGPSEQHRVNQHMTKYVARAYQPFQDGTLQPSVPSIRRIHAPMYLCRTTTLPGICFWMAGQITFKEDYLDHLCDIVAKRYDIDVMDVPSLSPHRLASFFADVCTAYPSSCEYISDFFTDHGQKIHVESFDDLVFRNAGDCEDVAKAICSIADHIRWTDWEGPVGQCLQTMATFYTPFSILGGVEKPSWYGASTSGMAAHMYVNFIPNHMVNRWLDLDLPIHEETLRVLCAEGTGHVACDFTDNETSASPCSACVPTSVQRFSKPHRANCFYKLHVHAYTNTLFRLGHNVGHLTFLDPKGHYGVSSPAIFEDKVSVYAHAGFTARDRREIDAVLRMEAPTPSLQVPTPMSIGSMYDEMNSMVCADHGSPTDYYVHSEHLQAMKKALQDMNPKGVQCFLEQTVENIDQHRIRVYT